MESNSTVHWHKVSELLPKDGQRILGFIPGNKFFLPGKTGEFEIREVVVLKFLLDFYPAGSEKREKHGAHFWQGEGNSNRFFADVTHWAMMPEGPGAK
ncbi:MAG: hypothetical protein ACKOW8_03665 [Flavobacteriales bacterium]